MHGLAGGSVRNLREEDWIPEGDEALAQEDCASASDATVRERRARDEGSDGLGRPSDSPHGSSVA
eukprot:3273146-Amphidinium_carterae.1